MFKKISSELGVLDKILIPIGFLADSLLKVFNIFIIVFVLMKNEEIKNFGFVKFFALFTLAFLFIFAIDFFIKKRNILRFADLKDKYFKMFLDRSMSMPYDMFENSEIMSKGKESNSFLASYESGFQNAYNQLLTIGSNLTFLLIIFAVAIYVDFKIFLALLFIVVCEFIFVDLISKYKEKYKKDGSKIEFKITNYSNFATDIKNANDIRLFSADKMYELYQNETLETYIKFMNKYYKAENVYNLMLSIFTGISIFTIIFILKDASVESIILISGILSIFSASVSITLKSFIQYNEEKLRYNVFNEFMTTTDKRYPIDKTPIFKDSIEFKNVTFSYPGSSEVILRDLSFKISKGEHIALLGLNGAGKSTVIKLLMGYYKPDKGQILIDGNDLSDYSYKSLSTLFAPMFQNVEPLALTIAEIVSSSERENQDEEKIISSLKTVGLYELVETLPEGIHTPLTKILNPTGYVFSGGGNQKLAMARVIYNSERPIVILDEPTAALDSIAEERVYRDLDSVLKDRSAIFITHRLASVKFLDKIMLLNDGKIVEEGSHDELMMKNGVYKSMYEKQAYYYKFEGEL